MGAHEQKRGRKIVWTGKGLVITCREELREMKFAPHFKSWPKIVQRLENHGFSCEMKLVGKTLSVTTSAELQQIQALLGNRRMMKKSKLWLILLTPVLLVLGSLSFTIQPQSHSTELKAKSIQNDKCGIEHLAKAIISDFPNTNVLERTSSRLGGIESGAFVCEGAKFSYTLELKEPKRVISLLKLDS
jgi:hypothetical protein